MEELNNLKSENKVKLKKKKSAKKIKILPKIIKINNIISVKNLFIIIFILMLLSIIIILYLFFHKKNNLHKIQYLQYKDKSFPFSYIDNHEIENKSLKEIHISYSLDNNLVYPTLVSMLSGLENNNNYLIVYYLLLSHNFNKSNIEIFESLKLNYTVKINYFIIPNIFSNLQKWTNGTDCVYYKILLPLLFPDYERMIYLDGDTLIRKDISKMYNYPFNDNYILGFPFYMSIVMDKFGIKAEHYISGGCLLFNIDKIRKDNKDVDLLQFTIKNNSVLEFREQDSINYIFYPKIGFLPLKYGIYMIGSNETFNKLSTNTRSPLNLTEGYEAIADPSIVHFSLCWPKVWNKGTRNLYTEHEICQRYQKEFYYYAKKTQYYSVIYNTLYFQKIS